jgi:hypothetical protein
VIYAYDDYGHVTGLLGTMNTFKITVITVLVLFLMAFCVPYSVMPTVHVSLQRMMLNEGI